MTKSISKVKHCLPVHIIITENSENLGKIKSLPHIMGYKVKRKKKLAIQTILYNVIGA